MAGAKLPEHYTPQLTEECKQVLALLISGLGEWRNSMVLIGGLTPEMLTRDGAVERKRDYVGTNDIDLVVNLEVVANMEAYSTIEHVLENKGFKPLRDGKSWQWEYVTETGHPIRIDFLADDGTEEGKKILPVADSKQLAACNIPHSNIAFDLFETQTIEIELPHGGGFKQVEIRYTDIVGFTVLKALAFDKRSEDKDAHDIVYCLENFRQPVVRIADRFSEALKGKHAEIIDRALSVLTRSFADGNGRAGFEKDGPSQATRFELGPTDDINRKLQRQREIADLLNELLTEIAKRLQAAQ
jgi:hypothetical protein